MIVYQLSNISTTIIHKKGYFLIYFWEFKIRGGMSKPSVSGVLFCY
jgi:hypothetical protein